MDIAEESFVNLSNIEGVEGILLATAEGTPLKSTFDIDKTSKYASIVSRFNVISQNMLNELDGDSFKESGRQLNEIDEQGVKHSVDTPLVVRIRKSLREIVILRGEDYFILVSQDVSQEGPGTGLL